MPFGHQRLTMKRDLLDWWTRPAWQRNPAHRKDILFAGPWVGEFGWELMNWQGYVRSLSASYEKVIVCARESSRMLYDDFADEFIPHGLKGTADHVVLRDIENREGLDEISLRITDEMDHLKPLRFIPASAQTFIRFGEMLPNPPCDVVLHARGNINHSHRNWPLEKWIQLCEALHDQGVRLGAVGLRSSTLDLPGVSDFRNVPLADTVDTIRSAQLVLGPSSGPMHLASLCGTPHVVWTNSGVYRMGKTSRQKYEHWWNPLHTPVQVLEGDEFDLSVDEVLRTVMFYIHR